MMTLMYYYDSTSFVGYRDKKYSVYYLMYELYSL